VKDKPPELTIRFTEESDAPFIKKWLSDPLVLRWFPLNDEREIDDAVRIWIGYVKQKSSLTALWNGEPCGSAVLNLQSFKKLAHTCLLTILVEESKRGLGVGTALLTDLEKLARDVFHIEIIHLEVYEDNPAKRLYDRMGYTCFGEHKGFTREAEKDRSKIFMEKILKTTPF
jgi:GNAT superfamily N-acetyltransferase